MVPMESRLSLPTMNLGRKYVGFEEKSRAWLCHGAFTGKVPNDFLSLGVLSILD